MYFPHITVCSYFSMFRTCLTVSYICLCTVGLLILLLINPLTLFVLTFDLCGQSNGLHHFFIVLALFGPSPKTVTHFSRGAAANKQPWGVLQWGGAPLFIGGGSKGAVPPRCPPGFLRLVDSQKRLWWIVGSRLPH